MAVILLSIKPEYAEKIFAGTKKYEYRRHVASEKVEKIIVYLFLYRSRYLYAPSRATAREGFFMPFLKRTKNYLAQNE